MAWDMAMTLAAAALLLAPTQLPRTARFAGYIAGRGTGVARRARAALDTIARESRLDALGEELRASVRDVERMRGEIRREMAASATEMKTRTDTGTGASATTMTTTSTSYGTERYTHATSTGNMGLFGTTSLLGDSADRIVFRVRPQPNAADLHGTSSLMEHTDERQQQQQQQRPKKRLGVAPAAAMGKVGSANFVTEKGSYDVGGGSETGADILVRTIEDENRDILPVVQQRRKS